MVSLKKIIVTCIYSGLLLHSYTYATEKIIQTEAKKLLAYDEITAVSIGIFNNGDTKQQHLGLLNETSSPDNNTLYEIASLTKTFTGTLVAKAILDKKITLDSNISTCLKGDYSNLSYKGSPITIKHLLTHRSGLPYMLPEQPNLFKKPNFDTLPFTILALKENFTRKDFFTHLKKVKLPHTPGESFIYSNLGTDVLGYCLENIYQQKFSQILKDQLLNEIGMNDSHLILTNKNKTRVAQGFNQNRKLMPLISEIKDIGASAGLTVSVSDMIKYMAYHLNEDNSAVKLSHQGLLEPNNNYQNGFLWQITFNKEDNTRKIFQNGGAFGTASWLTIVPEKKLGVFIVTNQMGPQTHQRLNEAADSLLHQLSQPSSPLVIPRLDHGIKTHE